jgi:hypothetical protein
MRKCLPLFAISIFALSLPAAFAGITLTSPGTGSSVASPVHFVASATSSCAKGVAAMGVYDANVLKTTAKGSKLDVSVALSTGTHSNVVVQYWDYCGGSNKWRFSLNVTSSTSPSTSLPSTAKTFANLEDQKGWLAYGELPPVYDICTDCSPKVTWGFKQGITSPAVGTVSTRFDVGGDVPYSDALFVNHLIGDGTTQNMPDRDGTILNSIRHIVYDVYVYSDHIERAHAIEFDMGLNVSGRAMMLGTECRTEAIKVWAVWDNPGHKWVNTTIPCEILDGKWNHLIIKFYRSSDNHMTYESITLNGKTYNLNWTYNSEPTAWHGMVANFQLDGNKYQNDYSVYLDKLNISYY